MLKFDFVLDKAHHLELLILEKSFTQLFIMMLLEAGHVAYTTSTFVMKDMNCSPKPSSGLCDPQNNAKQNMPLTVANQRGFIYQQFCYH